LARPRVPVRAVKWRLVVEFSRPIVYADYTGKLVKTILAKASPGLREVIEARPRAVAKPLSLSPLYTVAPGGRVQAVYPRARGPGAGAAPVTIQPRRVYWFHVGVETRLEPGLREAMAALMAGLRVPARPEPVEVRLVEASVVAEYSHREPRVAPGPGDRVKLVYMSPVLPSSPLHRGSRAKRLTPAPLHVLAVNLLALYREPGLGELAALDALVPSPSAMRAARVTWYLYGGKTLPGLTGYTVYAVDEEASEDQLETLSHVLSHAAAMGTGTSRATGFGDTRVEEYTVAGRGEGEGVEA